ncbi:FkbM family methyltransferase [Massilia sp. LC238]|uniref:FkbM family methyltransferase n=1 Tax=Massilia sp. LC238 TaxID=1502852 RepID=UPI0004E2DA52|nr:FkbM family methyltransferase [Massilia sp. LC238]KFC63325.1 FkbM family methyltransferase [Massilia sp. LC238]
MSFISYSQNAEDVLLWRALGQVENGFYIDVGANDPEEHSVTKAFYDAGWRGISIEPLPSFHQAFLEQRPRDVNLAIAAGSANGELTLYDTPQVRGWASPDQAVAELHRSEGHQVVELSVPVRTLASVCEEYVQGQQIHFLKIDVEGFEGEVLKGMDFARWRPWVLVIEATLPNSRETNHASWEHMVTSQRYRFVWFDGLNRYYVAEEHSELARHFGIQPNVFDDYISHHLDKSWAAAKRLSTALKASEQEARDNTERAARSIEQAHQTAMLAQQALQQAEQQKRDADTQILALQDALAASQLSGHHLTVWAQDMEARLTATYASTSWKITTPLRAAGRVVRALRRPGLARRVVTRVTRNERMRRLLIPVLLRYPALGQKVSSSLAAIKQAAPEPAAPGAAAVPEELKGLPVSVRAVLGDLQRARGQAGNRAGQ